MNTCGWQSHGAHQPADQNKINNLSPGYDMNAERQHCDKPMQVFWGCFFSFFCYLLPRVAYSFCHPLRCDDRAFKLLGQAEVGGGGGGSEGGLPDNGAASPAARRACQPAGGIEVNKLKCMYMLRDRLLSEQRGICGAGLLGSPGQP